jgi:hypothetical protein
MASPAGKSILPPTTSIYLADSPVAALASAASRSPSVVTFAVLSRLQPRL